MPNRLAVALLLVLLPAVALGQQAPPFERLADVPALSDEAEISLLTMLPGREVYSLFGHTAFRVRDPALGLDRTYNYGTFDFDQPGFVLRFARGQLLYQLAVASFERTLVEYQYLERPIIEQRLDLPADVEQDLFRFLETNFLPENRAYRYDFLFDNCSTRPRDALELALAQRLSYGEYAPPAATFRDLLQPYLEADPLLDLGIDLGLGAPVDREATPREAMFLPLELMRAFDAATLDGRPLVASTDTLFWVPGAGMPEEAFDWPLLLGWLLFVGGAALTLRAGRGPSRALRRFDAVLFGAIGLAGLVLAFLWFGTDHTVTRPNWNLLWAWPTHLFIAFIVGRQNRPGWLRVYGGMAGAAALAAVLLAPVLPQAFHPAAFPLALLLALRGGALALRASLPAAQPAP